MRPQCGLALPLPARDPAPRAVRRRRPEPSPISRPTPSRPLHGRVAALFALKQLDGAGSHGVLRKLAGDEALREFALRALADRKTELDGVEAAPFRAALADPSPRVRAQAVDRARTAGRRRRGPRASSP